MNLSERIEILSLLGSGLTEENDTEHPVYQKALAKNGWFTTENIIKSVQSISENLLNRKKLLKWASQYPEPLLNKSSDKTIGLVLAGNIPMVGFHDILSVLICGMHAQVKLSSKDALLIPHIIKMLDSISPELAQKVEFVDTLNGFDAVIATGNNNSARYFNYYFGKYPHIIRKNRNSVAVLDGTETSSELKAIGTDIFSYFGLGCRNVSKIYFPENYDVSIFFEGMESFSQLKDHNKYRNNYDYYRSILLLNKVKHLASDFLMLMEERPIASRIATMHYGFYENTETLNMELSLLDNEIQCKVSKIETINNAVKPGQSQNPELWDYADHIDTVKFLSGLN